MFNVALFMHVYDIYWKMLTTLNTVRGLHLNVTNVCIRHGSSYVMHSQYVIGTNQNGGHEHAELMNLST